MPLSVMFNARRRNGLSFEFIFSPNNKHAVSLDEFFKETQQILQDKGLL
jgi:hypothetical protein